MEIRNSELYPPKPGKQKIFFAENPYDRQIDWIDRSIEKLQNLRKKLCKKQITIVTHRKREEKNRTTALRCN